MEKAKRKIPILDIPGLGTFQFMHNNEFEMELNGTRVTLLFNADDRFYELAERFNSNESVPVLDFLNAQRQLKAKMFSLKERGR
jgi:hypothetical protein